MALSRRDALASAAAMAAANLLRAASGTGATAAAWSLPPPRPVRTIENLFIHLADGARLAARIWLPEDAVAAPVPAVLEYEPYRKRDFTRPWDDPWGPRLASYGYAFTRVDIRGTGDSDGVIADEYLPRQQRDSAEVIAWLARQPWCTGAVGMRGFSWGGIAALQAAALAPPELKAITTHCSTDLRFHTDAHYVGGALGLTNFEWGLLFKCFQAMPPDPTIVGPKWREMWRERLQAATPVLARWASHQREDAYWRQGSVGLDLSRIKCPVYAGGGMADPYVNTVLRLLAGLAVPRKGIIGPWAHGYPDGSAPGPGLDWVFEEVRWWEHWLKGVDSGLMDEPMLRVFMAEQTGSAVFPNDVPGRWVAEPAWPSPRTRDLPLHLAADGLRQQPGGRKLLRLEAKQAVGLGQRDWYVSNPFRQLPEEQSPADALSLTFDSEPLAESLEILGIPVARIRVRSSQPVAKLVARLTEVTPDGQSWLVAYGVLNLTHREGSGRPKPLPVGQDVDVAIPLEFRGYRFKPGHRIRLALSETLWPLLWPSPRQAVLQITTGASWLELPVRPSGIDDPPMPIPLLTDVNLPPANPPPPAPLPPGLEGPTFLVETAGPDPDGLVRVTITRRRPIRLAGTGTDLQANQDWVLEIRESDPNSSVWQGAVSFRFRRGDWDTEVRSAFRLDGTPDALRLTEAIAAFEGDRRVFRRRWRRRVARELL